MRSNVIGCNRMHFGALGSVLTLLEVFGFVRVCPDLFGYVRTCSDALSGNRMHSVRWEAFGHFRKFFDFWTWEANFYAEIRVQGLTISGANYSEAPLPLC